jgi:hypothetical protein
MFKKDNEPYLNIAAKTNIYLPRQSSTTTGQNFRFIVGEIKMIISTF